MFDIVICLCIHSHCSLNTPNQHFLRNIQWNIIMNVCYHSWRKILKHFEHIFVHHITSNCDQIVVCSFYKLKLLLLNPRTFGWKDHILLNISWRMIFDLEKCTRMYGCIKYNQLDHYQICSYACFQMWKVMRGISCMIWRMASFWISIYQ